MFGAAYLSSFLLVLGSDSWFILWGGLEINMISFIVLIYGMGVLKVESSMKYFFVQGAGSGLLFAIFCMGGNYVSEGVLLTLAYKMGAGPFFYWFPTFCEGISWSSCIMVMTLQKIIPLIFMESFISVFGWGVVFISMVVGIVGCFNETKLKKFMAFSSVHYAGWLIMCLMISSFMWVLYLFGYCMMMVGVLLSVGSSNILFVKDFVSVKSPLLFFFSMLNMGGMPPMLGFFLKWWVFLVLFSLSISVLWAVILMTASMFYVYMRVVYLGMVNYLFVSSFFEHKNLSAYKYKEWVYMGGMMSAPIMGWGFH